MGWLTLTMLAAILGVSEAALRFGCSTVSVQRLDPLVESGNIPSAHVHQIVGGDAFNATMDPKIDISQISTCTTCEFLENRSNYWTAVLYFRARNGSYHRCRSTPTPITTPSCWDGKNLGSRDHHLHMVSTAGEAFAVARPCPASHPVCMPQLALETMWDTAPFNDRSLWPEDGGQPFVWSHDGRLGYGTHADYVFGWQGDVLQRAMDSPCMFQACAAAAGPLTIQRRGAKNECNVKSTVTEQIDGWLDRLPGR
ncbi:hypothetical protein RB597_009934 [Gaeumannomyces tritici]